MRRRELWSCGNAWLNIDAWMRGYCGCRRLGKSQDPSFDRLGSRSAVPSTDDVEGASARQPDHQVSSVRKTESLC